VSVSHKDATAQKLKFADGQFAAYNLALYLGTMAVIVYCLVLDGSFLEIDRGFGSAMLSVRGTGSAANPGDGISVMVFDEFDVRIPEQEKNGIFVATKVIGFKQQQRVDRHGEPMECVDVATKCPCDDREMTPNGRATGGCIESKCMINGWCTASPGTMGDGDTANRANLQEKYSAVIENVEFMLITFQIVIEFPVFGFTKIVDLEPLRPGHNVWRIGDILKRLGTEYDSVKESGCIIVITMHWSCGEDGSDCLVDWDIFRADNPSAENAGNFVWDSNYSPPMKLKEELFGLEAVNVYESRYLQKVHGIKILFNVTGESRRFNFVALLMNVGSMVGIMSV